MMRAMRSDEDLMQAWSSGDATAFPELFHRYAGLLGRVLGRGLPRPEDSRDLVQQTFLQLHRARRDYRTGAPFRPWLLAIGANVRRMHLRASGRRPEVPVPTEELTAQVAPADPEKAERAAQVRAALDTLPPDQREVVWLHWFEGLSFQEVATIVGARDGTVRVRAHRAYERLREALGTSKA
jgi:RNA polymerase sigma-70 factor (ECF subfamily)